MALHYVDAAAAPGGDGSIETPWDTVADVNAASFNAGDSVLFKRGCTWREKLIPHDSGSSGSPVIYGAYGTGAKPRILGSAQVSGWTDEGGNIWYADCAADLVSLFFIGTDSVIHWGFEAVDKGSLNAEYEWWWDDPNNRLYIYAASDPDTRYASVEKPSIDYCVDNNSKDYITVQNLELAYCYDIGVRVMIRPGWTVDGCEIHHLGSKNEALAEGIISRGAGLTVKNCTIHNCGNHGINLSVDTAGQDVSAALIEHNIFYDCYHSMIDLQCSGGTFTSAVIRYNTFYCSADFDLEETCGGIYVLADHAAPNDINGVEIYYNLLYDIVEGGIVIRGAVDAPKIYNNTIYGALAGSTTGSYGIHIFSNNPGTADPSGVVIKNNVVMDTYSACLVVTDKDYIAACDNNLWYQSAGGGKAYATIEAASYHFDDFAAYKTATGWDAAGLWEDPDFTDAAGRDFNLKSTSPCINAGADVGLAEDHEGQGIW